MYCWRHTGRVYHITDNRMVTICGQQMFGNYASQWSVSGLDRPPIRRQLCLNCRKATDAQEAPPAGDAL